VLLAPSPKFHDHEVGEPVDISVNCTTSPGFGDAGDHVKFATGGEGAVEMVLIANVDPPPFDVVRLTGNELAVL
jgi:hypothetical protein